MEVIKKVCFHRKSKFLLYILYYTENTYPKTEYFEFTTVQKKTQTIENIQTMQ